MDESRDYYAEHKARIARAIETFAQNNAPGGVAARPGASSTRGVPHEKRRIAQPTQKAKHGRPDRDPQQPELIARPLTTEERLAQIPETPVRDVHMTMQESVMWLAMGLWVTDTRANITQAQRQWVSKRLCLHLSAKEIARLHGPLMAYIQEYHPGILDIVERQFHKKKEGVHEE